MTTNIEIFESESKGARASGSVRGSGFVIYAGSYAVGDSQVQFSLGEKPGRVPLRQGLINSGALAQEGSYYRFTKDVDFNSPSAAASIIWGSNLNGRKVFGIDEAPPLSHMLYFQIDSVRAIEGYKKDQLLYIADRDRALAEERKRKDAYTCQACGFRLKVADRHVIECHHLSPVAFGVRETLLDDLISLCPTCHRIAHMREPNYSASEIREILALGRIRFLGWNKSQPTMMRIDQDR